MKIMDKKDLMLLPINENNMTLSRNEIAKFEIILKKAASFRTLLSYYRCALMEVETKFNVLNEEFSLRYDRNPIESIKTRIKSPESIAEKIYKKNLPFDVSIVENNIFDIAGIRIICAFKDDIYMLANCLLMQDDITLINKKDYIKNPKSNGYRSLHLIVSIPIFLANEKRQMTVEVQLRTIAMDFWASLEHKLRYKKDVYDTEEIANELYRCAQDSADLDQRMLDIRKKLE